AAAGGAGSATLRLSHAQPTKVPKLTAAFKRAGVHRAEVAIVGADGTQRVVHADVVVTGASGNAVVFGSKPSRSRTDPLDCDPANKFIECGAITAPRAAIVKTPVTLQNSTPSSQYCYTVARVGAGKGVTTPLALSRLQQKRDLVYPSVNEFFAPSAYPGGTSTNVVGKPSVTSVNAGAAKAATSAASEPTSARAAQATQKVDKEVCVTFATQTVSWDLGDGTKIASGGAPPSPGASGRLALASPVISHAYQAAKTYPVTVVSRRFSINKSKLPSPADPEYAEKTRELFGGGLGNTEGDVDALVAKGLLTPYLVKTTIKLRVQDAVCGKPIMVKGVPVRSFAAVGYPDPFSTAVDGCLLIDTPLGGGHAVYEPFPGEYLSLNGVVVRRVAALEKDAQSSFGDRVASTDVLVDSTNGTLTARDLGELDLELFDPSRFGALRAIAAGRTNQIEVPAPSKKGSLVPGRATAALPDYGGGKNLSLPGGFTTTGGRVLLSADSTAFFRATVGPLGPINGGTPPVLLGGSTTVKRASADANEFKPGSTPDFSLDLSGLRLGAFVVKKFRLDHFPLDGWYGDGTFTFPIGAQEYELAAPYKAPPPGVNTTLKCAKSVDVGPSGLRIHDQEGFKFAGGRLTGFSIPLGPIGIDCFAASFNEKPFTLVGYVGGRFPVAGGEQPDDKKVDKIVDINACVLVAILENDEQTKGGCAIQPSEFGVVIEGVGIPASQKQFWLAVRGELDFVGQFKVNGGLDLRSIAGNVKIGAQIGITPRYYGPYRIGGEAFGNFHLKPAGFELGGQVNLALGFCPACANVRALISNKGLGACADTFLLSGGFVYPWGGSLSLFAGCGWENFAPIRISQTADSITPLGFAAQPLAQAAQSAPGATRVRVSSREAKAPALAFELEGEGRAPRATLIGPGGKRIVVPAKTGHTVLRADGTTVTNPRQFDPAKQIRVLTMDALPPDALAPQPVPFKPVGDGPHPTHVRPTVAVPFTPTTIVSVPDARAGDWRIEPHPGSARISRVRIREKLPKRQVTAKVVRGRDGRRLRYSVRPIAGQTVRFVEEGAGVARQIGRRVRGGSGELRFPGGYGPAGRRTIRVIIEQGGVPVERRALGSYVAPGPPPVAVPESLKVVREGRGVLRACWDRVPRATSYRVRVKGTDGSVKPVTTTGRCVALPGFDHSVGAHVDVQAVTSYGESPHPARDSLRRLPRAPRLDL
ncbi:MAG: hypothetical protein M3O34_14540, partial [Chloroflexota bacterium]|nr:hypothetical protein [Chloroflexota bacterium]